MRSVDIDLRFEEVPVKPRKRNLLVAVAVVAVLMTAAIPAHATFPGKNGRIAFRQDGEIFTMNPDGSDVKQLTHVTPDGSADWASWSADGKQIVFNESLPPDGTPELWLMNADGSNQHRLFAERRYSENRPSFSPDGSKVVFARCKLFVGDQDTCAIHTVNLDGTGLKAVVPFRLDDTQRNPMFSPDSKTIAFIISPDAHQGFQGVTYLVNTDGLNLRRITDPEPCFIRPDWSPDGTKLVAFTHFCNPQPSEIAVVNPDGTGLQSLTHNGKDYFSGFHDRNPAFSPDGNFIVFERNAPDFSSSAIYVMKVDGSSLKEIAVLPAPKRAPHKFDPRGRLKKIEEGGLRPRWGVAPQ